MPTKTHNLRTTRRSVLAGGFAAIGAPSAAAQAATQETPIQLLFKEWLAIERMANSDDSVDVDKAVEACWDLETRIAELPSQCLADLAAKIIAVTGNGHSDFEEGAGPQNPLIWAEMRELAGVLEGGGAHV